MDRLIEDYEKALTEEFELRNKMDEHQSALTYWETEEWCRIITEDPKLPQWKAQHVMALILDKSPTYRKIQTKLIGTRLEHGHAKIYLAIAVERLKLTRARLYGGHHDLLDMQEVEQTLDTALD